MIRDGEFNFLKEGPPAKIKHAAGVDVFLVPAHTHTGQETGYGALAEGFNRAGINQTVVGWKNGQETTVSEQAQHLHRIITESRPSRVRYAPFMLGGISRGTTVVLRETERIMDDSALRDRLAGIFLFSTSPYEEPVFSAFKAHVDRYPSDYANYSLQIKEDLEGHHLPDLKRGLYLYKFIQHRKKHYIHIK